MSVSTTTTTDPASRSAARTPPSGPSAGGSRALRRRRTLTALAMLAPALAGLVVFWAYPLVATFYYSFTRFDLISDPTWAGLTNYHYLFGQDPRVWQAARNTLWFVAILVPLKIVFALATAALLTRARRGAGVWRTIYYLPALVPPVASTLSFVFLFNPGTGPVNQILKVFGIQGPLWFNDPAWSKPSLTLLGLWALGDIMIIFLASLLDVPMELYEAAGLDGAGPVQRWRYVTLPHLRPVLVFALITGVIAALQYFTEPSVAGAVASGKATVGEGGSSVLGYPLGSTLTYPMWLYDQGFSRYALGYASAMAVLLFVVSAFFIILILRRTRAFEPPEGT